MPANKQSSWTLLDIGGGNFSLTNTFVNIASCTAAEAAVLMQAKATPVLWTKSTSSSIAFPLAQGGNNQTIQVSGLTTSGSGTVTVAVMVSNDNVNWLTLSTLSFTAGTGGGSDGFAFDANWAMMKLTVTALPANCTVAAYLGG